MQKEIQQKRWCLVFMSNEFLVGVYKEVGKPPDIIKIKNQKEYLEKLVDGEYTNIDYDDYTIIYKKQSENLLKTWNFFKRQSICYR